MMKALVVGTDSVIRIEEVPTPVPRPGQVLVKITAAALNRRDYWITQGLYPKIQLPSILGSDGCGVVSAVTKGNENWLGKTVVINPNLNWGNDEEVPSPSYSILGMPTAGTFAEFICVDADRGVKKNRENFFADEKPTHLTDAEAAAFPLAGLTGYRALVVKGQVKPGQKVLVTGIGSGVAQLVAQIAVQIGAKVFVTTSSEERIELAKKKLGVEGGFNYKSEGWASKARKSVGEFDLVIDGTGGKDFNSALNLLRVGGKLVTYGATAGAVSGFPIHSVFLLHKQIIGTSMGSDKDFKDLVNFISKNKMKPSVDTTRHYTEFQDAFDRMKKGEQLGKIVLSFVQNPKL